MAGLASMISRSELDQLKAYVTAPGKLGANQADSTVLLHVTHSNLRAEFMELRFDKHVRIPRKAAVCCRELLLLSAHVAAFNHHFLCPVGHG